MFCHPPPAISCFLLSSLAPIFIIALITHVDDGYNNFSFFFTPNICRQRRVSVQRSSLDKIWWPWSTGTYYPDLLDTADKTVFCRAACVDRLYSYLDRSYTVATLFGYYRKFDGADHDNQNDEYIKTPGSLSCVAVCSSQLAAAVCIFQYFVVFRKL